MKTYYYIQDKIWSQKKKLKVFSLCFTDNIFFRKKVLAQKKMYVSYLLVLNIFWLLKEQFFY